MVHDPFPYVGASWPVPWIEVLRDLEAIPIATMVPGHGPVMHDHSYTRRVRTLLEAATSRVEAMARQGMTLDQVQGAIDLEDVRKGYPPWENPAANADFMDTIRVLVERAWRGVRGQG